MALYNELKDFFDGNPQLKDAFVQKGVISIDVVNRVDMYNYYEELYQGNRRLRTTAIEQTALKFKCSINTVYRMIAFMES